ncbi:hypothetical protein N2152v2_010243 [Parachlorella kessleri]
MGKKKATDRGKAQPVAAPGSPAAPQHSNGGINTSPKQAAQALNGKHAPSQHGTAALEEEAASLAAQLARKTEALEAAADEVAVLRSKCKDAELQLTRLAAGAQAARDEAAADRGVAALALDAATSARRTNYVLGIATTLSLAAAVVAVVRVDASRERPSQQQQQQQPPLEPAPPLRTAPAGAMQWQAVHHPLHGAPLGESCQAQARQWGRQGQEVAGSAAGSEEDERDNKAGSEGEEDGSEESSPEDEGSSEEEGDGDEYGMEMGDDVEGPSATIAGTAAGTAGPSRAAEPYPDDEEERQRKAAFATKRGWWLGQDWRRREDGSVMKAGLCLGGDLNIPKGMLEYFFLSYGTPPQPETLRRLRELANALELHEGDNLCFKPLAKKWWRAPGTTRLPTCLVWTEPPAWNGRASGRQSGLPHRLQRHHSAQHHLQEPCSGRPRLTPLAGGLPSGDNLREAGARQRDEGQQGGWPAPPTRVASKWWRVVDISIYPGWEAVRTPAVSSTCDFSVPSECTRMGRKDFKEVIAALGLGLHNQLVMRRVLPETQNGLPVIRVGVRGEQGGVPAGRQPNRQVAAAGARRQGPRKRRREGASAAAAAAAGRTRHCGEGRGKQAAPATAGAAGAVAHGVAAASPHGPQQGSPHDIQVATQQAEHAGQPSAPAAAPGHIMLTRTSKRDPRLRLQANERSDEQEEQVPVPPPRQPVPCAPQPPPPLAAGGGGGAAVRPSAAAAAPAAAAAAPGTPVARVIPVGRQPQQVQQQQQQQQHVQPQQEPPPPPSPPQQQVQPPQQGQHVAQQQDQVERLSPDEMLDKLQPELERTEVMASLLNRTAHGQEQAGTQQQEELSSDAMLVKLQQALEHTRVEALLGDLEVAFPDMNYDRQRWVHAAIVRAAREKKWERVEQLIAKALAKPHGK